MRGKHLRNALFIVVGLLLWALWSLYHDELSSRGASFLLALSMSLRHRLLAVFSCFSKLENKALAYECGLDSVATHPFDSADALFATKSRSREHNSILCR